ncbi:MAG: hypothetical protein V4439_02065 [Patescibacteria group bacterium]
MKKYIFVSLLAFFLVFVGTHTAFAGLVFFAGKVTVAPIAKEIQGPEDAGYICPVDGITFDILPTINGGPQGPYIIRSTGVKKITKGVPTTNKYITGWYNPLRIPITCIYPGSSATAVINIYSVKSFGLPGIIGKK